MKTVQSIELNHVSQEERLPDFTPAFPCLASRAILDSRLYPEAPWHWHRTVELFYVESGTLEYTTPGGKWIFPAGSGGFLNSNVLHTSRMLSPEQEVVELLYLFTTEFLAGEQESRLMEKYIRPLTASEVEMIPLYPEDPDQAAVLQGLCNAFTVSEEDWGYEFVLRQRLAEIWLQLLELAEPVLRLHSPDRATDETLKVMLTYIRDHYPEQISVEALAAVAHISPRVCFRLFRDRLRTTPVAYLTAFRLERACHLLTETSESVTRIAYSCGLGSSSYFGKLFRQHYGCTPVQYRRQWQDRYKNHR